MISKELPTDCHALNVTAFFVDLSAHSVDSLIEFSAPNVRTLAEELSYSSMEVIRAGSFASLEYCKDVLYSCKSLIRIEPGAFPKLRGCNTLVIGCPKLETIESGTFPELIETGDAIARCHRLVTIENGAFPKLTKCGIFLTGCELLEKIGSYPCLSEVTQMLENLPSIREIEPFPSLVECRSMYWGCPGLTGLGEGLFPSLKRPVWTGRGFIRNN